MRPRSKMIWAFAFLFDAGKEPCHCTWVPKKNEAKGGLGHVHTL
jgi:hypothetical protein